MSDSEKSAEKDDVNKLLLDSVSRGVDSLDKHKYKDGEDTKKLFGFIELDSAIANMIEVSYNAFIGSATKYLTPRTYATVQKYGKNYLDATSLNRTAAGVAFAVNAGVYALPSITDAYQLWNKQHDALEEKVRQLSPVLDDLKGKHGIAAYNSVRMDQNEMIAYDRWRTAKINHANLSNMILPAVAKIAPNVWFHERNTIEALRRGEKLSDIQQERFYSDVAKAHGETIADVANKSAADKDKIEAGDVTHEHVAKFKDEPSVARAIKSTKEAQRRKSKESDGFNLDGFAGVFGSNAALTTIANKLVDSSARKLKRAFTAQYDAVDMVLNLQAQLGSDPIPHSFQLPNRGRALPLEAYIAEIMIQHQRDMAAMNPEYTEIRDALKENVIAAAKPLAKAISKGDIGALSLINYIGSGKIIRNKGRAIASHNDVEAMIEHDEGKRVEQATIDPKEFWSAAPYNEHEGRKAFNALQGEERQIAISLIPRDLRKQFGVSDKESAAVDALTAKEIDAHIAQMALGADKLGSETLHDMGLASSEVRQVQADADKIRDEGMGAVHGLKSSAARPNGLDRMLLAVAVGSEVKGDKVHLGTILKDGRAQLSELETSGKRGADNDNMRDADNDNSFAERENERRNGTDAAELYRD